MPTMRLRFFDRCTHSSMDRIMDSGSIDWGSTPHGCTQSLHSSEFQTCGGIFLYSTLEPTSQKCSGADYFRQIIPIAVRINYTKINSLMAKTIK